MLQLLHYRRRRCLVTCNPRVIRSHRVHVPLWPFVGVLVVLGIREFNSWASLKIASWNFQLVVFNLDYLFPII